MPLRRGVQRRSRRCRTHPGSCKTIHVVSLVSEEPNIVNVTDASLEESVVGPEPAGGQAVDDGVDEGEEAVGVEVAPLGDPPGHDRRRRRREGQLKTGNS